MIWSRLLFNTMCSLFANNPAILVQADPDNPTFRVIEGEFTYSLDLTIDDLTIRTDALLQEDSTVAPEVAPKMVNDPETGDRVSIHALEDASNSHFQTNGAPAEPFTVKGFALTNGAGDTLLAVQEFDEPVTITGAAQLIGFIRPTFHFPTSMVR